MRRSTQVTAPLLAAAALAMLAGCRKPEMQRCVDENNHVVDAKLCQTQPGLQQHADPYYPLLYPHYHYYYGGWGGYGLGSIVGGGGYSPLAGHSYSFGSSGTTRGGFGSSFSSSSGGHGSAGE